MLQVTFFSLLPWHKHKHLTAIEKFGLILNWSIFYDPLKQDMR